MFTHGSAPYWDWLHVLEQGQSVKEHFPTQAQLSIRPANCGVLAAPYLGSLSQKGWWNPGHALQLMKRVALQGSQAVLQRTAFKVLQSSPLHTHLFLKKAWQGYLKIICGASWCSRHLRISLSSVLRRVDYTSSKGVQNVAGESLTFLREDKNSWI